MAKNNKPTAVAPPPPKAAPEPEVKPLTPGKEPEASTESPETESPEIPNAPKVENAAPRGLYAIPTREQYEEAGYDPDTYDQRFVNGVDTWYQPPKAKTEPKPVMTRGYQFAPVGADQQISVVAGEEAAKGETVTMVFPVDVMLTVDYHKKLFYRAGVNEVPVEYADHAWLKQNKVRRHRK